MTKGPAGSGDAWGDEVIADFVTEPDDGIDIVVQAEDGLDEFFESIRAGIQTHRIVFGLCLPNIDIQVELLKRRALSRDRFRDQFRRVVMLDVGHGRGPEGEFDLAAFYRYALQRCAKSFEFASAQVSPREELLQLLKDVPCSLLCLLNMEAADTVSRNHLRQLTQLGHKTLIFYSKPLVASQTPDKATAFLTEISGDECFELLTETTRIGRSPKCELVIEKRYVSRFHAEITAKNGEFFIEDSGSQNGTYLNSKLLEGAEVLNDCDRIAFSNRYQFVFHRDAVPKFARTDTKLEALKQINTKVPNTGLDQLLQNVLKSLLTIFPAADRGFVVMRDDEGQIVPQAVKTRKKSAEHETVLISETIIKNVFDSGEVLLSDNALEDDRFEDSDSTAGSSIRSLVCVPLTDSEGSVFGALQIDSKQAGQFDDKDVELMTGVANQAGMVIDSARMHEQLLLQREVERDLLLANSVKQAFLPHQPPVVSGYRFSSFYKAAERIRGDYFDYIGLPDGRTAIVVADIVGHGVAAAMFMARLSAETRYCLGSDSDLAAAIDHLNDRVSNLHVDRYVTFLLLVVDPNHRNVTIVNAGHMPPLLRTASDGSISEPGADEAGLPMAIDSGVNYEAVTFEMTNGDIAVIYTDGIKEAMNAHDEEFGIDRLRELTGQGGDADAIQKRIVDAVIDHVDGKPMMDDMCLVVIERVAT